MAVLGSYTAVWTAKVVRHSFSPAIDWDQWDVIKDLIRSKGQITARLLWAQHNEHRIPFGHLAYYADLRWFGGRNVSLLIENYLIHLAALGTFAFMLHRFGRLSRSATLTLLGFTAFCMFSPTQIDNFVRGFQVTFVLCILAAILAFSAAVLHKRFGDKPGSGTLSPYLVAALFFAVIAEFSLSSGLLVWPILLLLGYGSKFSRRTQLVILCAGFLSIGAYFIHFSFPPHESKPLESLSHPLDLWRYILMYFGSTWRDYMVQRIGPVVSLVPVTGSTWSTMVDLLTTAALGLAGCFGIRFLVRRTDDGLSGFLFANTAFAISSAALTALGRLNAGLAQAASNRYQTVSLLFWASLVIWVFTKIGGQRRWAKLLAAQVFLLIMVGTALAHFHPYKQYAMDRKADLAAAYRWLMDGSEDGSRLAVLSPMPFMVPDLFSYLESKGWGASASDFGELSSVRNGNHDFRVTRHRRAISPKVDGYTVGPKILCQGFLDEVTGPDSFGQLAARGWAWDWTEQEPAKRIILVLATGKVVGHTVTGLRRPDVPKNVPGVAAANTGWATRVEIPKNTVLRAFVVMDDGTSACPLKGEFRN